MGDSFPEVGMVFSVVCVLVRPRTENKITLGLLPSKLVMTTSSYKI